MSIDVNNKYLIGISWFILSLLISCFNDVLMKYLGSNIASYQVVFLRFLFGTITLLPFMLHNKSSFKTSRISLHIVRGALLFGGILFWCLGLNAVKITTATIINFTIPIFVLVLAVIFLKERLNKFRIIATAIGFLGILVVLNPNSIEFNTISILLILASIMFASLDVLNKKFVANESMLSMLFYSSFFTMLFSLYPAITVWTTPCYHDILLLILLGSGANLVLYCLLKAFSQVDASAVAPYRYIELLFSTGFGYFIFNELPGSSTIFGALIVIFATLFLAYEYLIAKKAI